MLRLLAAVFVVAVASACFVAPPENPSDAGQHSGGGGGSGGGAGGGGSGGASGNDSGFIACVDSNEPNNSPDSGTATQVRMHLVGAGPIQLEGMMCDNETSDWFRGFADCCPGYGVTVTWDAGMGTLKVSLYDDALNELTADGGLELVDTRPGYVKLIDMDRGGYFFARVYLLQGPRTSNVPYTLQLQAPVYGP